MKHILKSYSSDAPRPQHLHAYLGHALITTHFAQELLDNQLNEKSTLNLCAISWSFPNDHSFFTWNTEASSK